MIKIGICTVAMNMTVTTRGDSCQSGVDDGQSGHLRMLGTQSDF